MSKVITNKNRFNKRFGFEKDEAHSLDDISKITGVSKNILQKSYDRGIGAWKSNIKSVRLRDGRKNPNLSKFPRGARMSKERWAISRVYAMIMGALSDGKFSPADKDLQPEVKKAISP